MKTLEERARELCECLTCNDALCNHCKKDDRRCQKFNRVMFALKRLVIDITDLFKNEDEWPYQQIKKVINREVK